MRVCVCVYFDPLQSEYYMDEETVLRWIFRNRLSGSPVAFAVFARFICGSIVVFILVEGRPVGFSMIWEIRN